MMSHPFNDLLDNNFTNKFVFLGNRLLIKLRYYMITASILTYVILSKIFECIMTDECMFKVWQIFSSSETPNHWIVQILCYTRIRDVIVQYHYINVNIRGIVVGNIRSRIHAVHTHCHIHIHQAYYSILVWLVLISGLNKTKASFQVTVAIWCGDIVYHILSNVKMLTFFAKRAGMAAEHPPFIIAPISISTTMVGIFLKTSKISKRKCLRTLLL